MPKSMFYCEYKLKKNTIVSDFLAASEKLNNEYISKQKGYISWEQWNDGDVWVDVIAFDSIEDAKGFEEKSNANPNDFAMNFYSFINLMSCKVRYYNIERTYGAAKCCNDVIS